MSRETSERALDVNVKQNAISYNLEAHERSLQGKDAEECPAFLRLQSAVHFI